MSALQKLAVAREVGTSRPATSGSRSGATADHSNGLRSADAQQLQQPALLHPLLQSLNFPLPASSGSTNDAKPRQQNLASSNAAQRLHAPDSNSKTPAGAASSTSSTQAASALAAALKQQNSHSTQPTHFPVDQLLASIAAAQQLQQLQQQASQSAGAAISFAQAQPAVHTPGGVDVSLVAPHPCRNGSSNNRWLRQCASSNSSKNALGLAQTSALPAATPAPAAAAAAAAAVRRPVTPHITKPHRPGSIRVQPAAATGATAAAAAALHCAAGYSQQAACSELLLAARPCTAGCSQSRTAGSSTTLQLCSAAETAAARPGTAAAFKILRAMGVMNCTPRPVTSSCLRASHSTPGCGVFCQMTPQPEMQYVSPNEKNWQPQQQQKQQQQDAGFSRPATAELRALLASSHSKDGIAERLEYYRKVNSSNDHSDGMDIVHEEGSVDETDMELPDWLKATPAAAASACQAAPMVLSMEDPCQSTPEVLQQELAQQLEEQLEALDVSQLQALKDAVCRQMALG